MKAVKKPIEVQVFHATPAKQKKLYDIYKSKSVNFTELEEIPFWIVLALIKGVIFFDCDVCTTIKTLEGDHGVENNDWIVQGVEGELYPVKNEIFRETYDIV